LNNAIQKIASFILPEKVLTGIKKSYYPWRLRFCRAKEIDLEVIRTLIGHGDVVVDIGANIGGYTYHFSKLVGLQGRVFSIEPIPVTFEILCSNVKKLGLNNVEVFNCAISDDDDWLVMEIPKYESGLKNYYQAKIVDNETANSLNRTKVNSKKIDSLLPYLANAISFIKCDIEGHELNCIRGAANIIRCSRPAWYIEISGNPDDANSPAFEAFCLLKKGGYEAYWFDGTYLKKRLAGDKSVNYFFLTERHIKALERKKSIEFVLDSSF
jgi:FkbM family methyltransferase